MSSLSSGLIPLGNSSTARSSGLADMAPLQAISGKGKSAYSSSNWDGDLDDLIKDLDSPKDKKRSKGGKGKPKGKKASDKSYKSKRLDESNDSLFESSDNFASNPGANKPDFDLSIASDFGSPGNKGGDLLGDLVTSKDLEDSILGGLVGGFRKQSKTVTQAVKPQPAPAARSPPQRVPRPDRMDSSDNSFDDVDVPIYDKEKRPSAAATKRSIGYEPSAYGIPKKSVPAAPVADFDESESFDEANLPIFGNDQPRPSTAGSAVVRSTLSAADTRPMTASAVSSLPSGLGKKSASSRYDESDSFDDTNLPIFDKEKRPSAAVKKSRSPSPHKSSPSKNTFDESSSFDETNLPIFGAATRQNSGPLGDRPKIISPAGSKKDLLAATRASSADPVDSLTVVGRQSEQDVSESSDVGHKSAMPFIPSFYDAKPRSRRSLTSGPDSNKPAKASGADELDKLLGIGAAASNSNKESIKDPFSASSKSPRSILPASLSSIGSRGQTKFSDSSDSEADLGKQKKPVAVEKPKNAEVEPNMVPSSDKKKAVTATEVEAAVPTARPQIVPVEREKPSSTIGLTIDPDSPPAKSVLKYSRKSPGSEKFNSAGSNNYTSPEGKVQTTRFASAANEEDRLEEVVVVDRHGNYPAWLGGGTPGGNSTASTGRLGTPNDRDGRVGSENQDKLYRTMQQRLEQIQLEKEAVERQLRLEIENLKTGSALFRQSSGETLFYRGSSFNVEQPDNNSHLIQELKNEIAKLKDELNIQTSKHQDNIKEENERAARLIEGAENKRRDDIRVIEMRHEEAVSALKRIHAEELAVIKQRARDGLALEELSSQIRTSTGSLRLIEEHMNSQYKGLDIVREGQFEARERVLAAAEEKSRERAELAEAEGYRLKGILVHMEQMVASLRSQGSEERERLKYEHRRLEMAQISLDQERKVHYERIQNETDELKKRMADFSESMRKQESDLYKRKHELEESIIKQDNDKESFKNHVTNTIKSTEDGLKRLKEEETKLIKLREDIKRESNKMKDERSLAVNDLLRSDEFYAQIEQDKFKVDVDRAALENTARKVQETSEELRALGAELELKSENMLERELALELGLRELYQSGAMLSRKEHDVINTTKALESKQLSIRSAEDNALFQRISAAAIHREAHRLRSSGPSVVSARNRLEQITSNGPPGNQLPSQHIKIVAEVERDKELEDELRSIQRSIRSSKHTLDKNANARNATFGFLTQEVNYISSSGYY